MGKRELGLIVAFIVAGVIVWQVTAPKAEGPGFSFGNWFGEVRREMRGRNASAQVTTTPAIPIDASINELRLTLSGEVTIKGEDRADVAAELKVVSNGFDEAEASKLAGEVGLKVSRFADSVVVAWQFPDPGRQQPVLTLRVPSRLRIQLEGRGTATVSGVDAVTLARQSGTLELTEIAGVVKGESRGRVTVEGAGAVDLSTANVETVLKGVRGDVRMNVRSGETRIEQATGRVTITGTDTRVRVDGSAGELRAEMVEGELEFTEVSGPIEIDGRSTPVMLTFASAAAAKIQVREGSLEIVLPRDAASYNLDARASGGELRVPDQLQKTTEGGDTAVRKSGGPNAQPIFVRGVGTTITIR
ncbi:MAG TPA: DUF4097 family beta strand repeat-containing protein [Vicinamibacterales bacterium]